MYIVRVVIYKYLQIYIWNCPHVNTGRYGTTGHMFSLSFWLLLSALWGTTLANTEIVNFLANEEPDAIIPLAIPW